jgi:hypothetical protein
MAHGSGPYHGKDKNKATKSRRERSWHRCRKRKDRHVRQSSKGAFHSVAELEAHRIRVTKR